MIWVFGNSSSAEENCRVFGVEHFLSGYLELGYADALNLSLESYVLT
jgi:hypothetical protein